MEYLSNYIKYMTTNIYDGHIHLFSHRGSIMGNKGFNIPSQYDKVIGFMDIEFNDLDKYSHNDVIKYYDIFIKNYYDSSKMILLSTGIDSKMAIDVHKKYPHIIKGFGEFKCYDHYVHGKLPFGNLDWIEDVCKYDIELGLPIYIHWDLKNIARIEKLEQLLNKYPTIPFVLCHCGMSDSCDNNFVFDNIIKLCTIYKNLFIDISYSATNYFLAHLDNIKQLPPNKVLIGSDLNPVLQDHNNTSLYDNEYKKLNTLNQYINCNITTQKLFNL